MIVTAMVLIEVKSAAVLLGPHVSVGIQSIHGTSHQIQLITWLITAEILKVKGGLTVIEEQMIGNGSTVMSPNVECESSNQTVLQNTYSHTVVCRKRKSCHMMTNLYNEMCYFFIYKRFILKIMKYMWDLDEGTERSFIFVFLHFHLQFDSILYKVCPFLPNLYVTISNILYSILLINFLYSCFDLFLHSLFLALNLYS